MQKSKPVIQPLLRYSLLRHSVITQGLLEFYRRVPLTIDQMDEARAQREHWAREHTERDQKQRARNQVVKDHNCRCGSEIYAMYLKQLVEDGPVVAITVECADYAHRYVMTALDANENMLIAMLCRTCDCYFWHSENELHYTCEDCLRNIK